MLYISEELVIRYQFWYFITRFSNSLVSNALLNCTQHLLAQLFQCFQCWLCQCYSGFRQTSSCLAAHPLLRSDLCSYSRSASSDVMISCFVVSLRRRHTCHPIVGESVDCEPKQPKHRRFHFRHPKTLTLREWREFALSFSSVPTECCDHNMSALSDVLPKNKELIAECETTTTSKEGETYFF